MAAPAETIGARLRGALPVERLENTGFPGRWVGATWAWQEVNRQAADRTQCKPRRGADGELYDGEGTAL